MNLSDNTYLISGHRQKIGWDIGKVVSSLHRMATTFIENRRHARDMRALGRFSDRELWDLGLSRSDLWSIERGTFRRD